MPIETEFGESVAGENGISSRNFPNLKITSVGVRPLGAIFVQLAQTNQVVHIVRRSIAPVVDINLPDLDKSSPGGKFTAKVETAKNDNISSDPLITINSNAFNSTGKSRTSDIRMQAEIVDSVDPGHNSVIKSDTEFLNKRMVQEKSLPDREQISYQAASIQIGSSQQALDLRKQSTKFSFLRSRALMVSLNF
jgi:hypothetical protein